MMYLVYFMYIFIIYRVYYPERYNGTMSIINYSESEPLFWL